MYQSVPAARLIAGVLVPQARVRAVSHIPLCGLVDWGLGFRIKDLGYNVEVIEVSVWEKACLGRQETVSEGEHCTLGVVALVPLSPIQPAAVD